MAVRSKVYVCGRSPAEIVGSNPTGGMGVCLLWVLWGRGLWKEPITRPEESYRLWCVVVCDLETSRMWRPWPALGRSATAKKKTHNHHACYMPAPYHTHSFDYSNSVWWEIKFFPTFTPSMARDWEWRERSVLKTILNTSHVIRFLVLLHSFNNY